MSAGHFHCVKHCDGNVESYIALRQSVQRLNDPGRGTRFLSQRPAALKEVAAVSFSGLNVPEHEACQFLSFTEVKNEWNCTVLPLYALCTQFYLLLCSAAEA